MLWSVLLVRTLFQLVREAWPLTWTGTSLLAGSAILKLLGGRWVDFSFKTAGVWGLAIAAAAGLLTWVDRWRLKRSIRSVQASGAAATLTGVEGYRLATGFELRRRWLPWIAEPELSWLEPRVRVELVPTSGTLREEVVPAERCRCDRIQRVWVCSDLFGLWRLRLISNEVRAVAFEPDLGRLERAAVVTALAAGDQMPDHRARAVGDPLDSRPYTRSDPARRILWRVYARTGELLVRSPESAHQPARRPLLYFVAGHNDDASAGLARLLIESSVSLLQFPFACDGKPEPTIDRVAACEALARSREHRERGGADLLAALAHPRLEHNTPVVLIVPAEQSGWQSRVAALLAERPARYTVVSAADLESTRRSTTAPPSRIWSWMLQPEPSSLTFEQLQAELERALPAGVGWMVADRCGGRTASGIAA
jgi:hypothetical protein